MTLYADTAVGLWVPSRIVRAVISLEHVSEMKVNLKVRVSTYSSVSNWLFLTAMAVDSSDKKNGLYR